MSIELLNIDCMEYMKDQENASFDLCVTSPPYNMNLRINSNGDGYCSRQIIKELSTKYNNFNDNLPMEEYYIFLSNFIKEAVRVSSILFLNIQQITGNKPAIFRAINDNVDNLKETIIWNKCKAQPAIGENTLNSQFEYIFVFGDNPIARQFTGTNFDRGTESNVWNIASTKGYSPDHKAGFPIELSNKILRLFSWPGADIFDPFMGTGTTAVSAHYSKCNFVGCELDKGYYELAQNRFDKQTSQNALF